MRRDESAFRVDVFEYEEVDQATGAIRRVVIPDPRRYEVIESDGETVLFDKLDKTSFPYAEIMESVTEHMAATPATHERQDIDDANDYIESRRRLIAEALDGALEASPCEDPSEVYLESVGEGQLAFVVLSVDIVGSTIMSMDLSEEDYARVITVFAAELSLIAKLFHGRVLNYPGDGLIVFFPEPNLMRKHDLAIDCALTMRALVRAALAPELSARGLPPIRVRIGLDSGKAPVVTMGAPGAKRQKNLIGRTINLASKIQAQCGPDEILLGETAARQLHTMWRVHLDPKATDAGWTYSYEDDTPYKVFRLSDWDEPQ